MNECCEGLKYCHRRRSNYYSEHMQRWMGVVDEWQFVTSLAALSQVGQAPLSLFRDVVSFTDNRLLPA